MLSTLTVSGPNPEYAISELPIQIGSPDQKSSRHGAGSDGVREKQPWARGEQTNEKPSDSAPSSEPGKAPSGDGQQSSADGQDAAKQDRNATDSQPESKNEPSRKSPGTGDTQAGRDKTKDGSQSPASKDSDKKTGSDSDAARQGRPESSQESPDAKQGSDSLPPLRVYELLKAPLDLSSQLVLTLAKWIIYGILAAVALWWLWTSRDALLAALGNLGNWLANFWHNLFGGATHRGSESVDEAAARRAPLPRFADFIDPFAAGTAGRYAPDELVRYTFEALEAWARDRGCPRHIEQTPHEFARGLGASVSPLAEDATRLADLYSQVAYAPGTLPAASVACLPNLWRTLRSEAVGMKQGSTA